MTDFTIRPVTRDEYDAVGDLVATVYAGLRPLRPEYEAEIRRVADRAGGADVLVAVEDSGDLLGTVTFVSGEGGWAREIAADDEVEFRMLAVSAAAQGRGVGRALVDECLDRARALGRRRVVISSGEWMTAAHRLYERMDFRRTPDRDWSPAPGILLLGFELDL